MADRTRFACDRTGWPAFTGDQLDSFGYDRAEILRRLRFFKPRYSLREVAQYSNPGFFVAGEVAARCAKHSWNDLVEQRLFSAFADVTLWDRDQSSARSQSPRPRMHSLTGNLAVVEPTIARRHGRGQFLHFYRRRHVKIDADVCEQRDVQR